MSIKQANAEATTTARDLAVSDIRNAVSFAAMNKLMVPLVNPELILNVDATSFTVDKDCHEKIKIEYIEKKGKIFFLFEKKG
jgi:hypothetical protein